MRRTRCGSSGCAVVGARLSIHGDLRDGHVDWLKEASFAAVARRLPLTLDEVDGIMARAVERGRARREEATPSRIGLDETSFQKRHEYVTVVTDLDRSRVVAVLGGRTKEAVETHFAGVPEASRSAVKVVTMDMWRPSMDAAKWLPNASVCFDRFHVARHLGDAVNTVRKTEHRALRSEGDRTLTGTKYVWLEKSTEHAAEATRDAVAAERRVCTHRASVGVEGTGGKVVGLCESGVSPQGMEGVDRPGGTEQAGADGDGSTAGSDTPRRDPERGGAAGDQRPGGVDEREDPADQTDGVRVPESRPLSYRDPVPSRRA